MKNTQVLWMVCRIGLIIACMFVLPYAMFDQRKDFSEASLMFPIAAIVICAASVIVLLWLRGANGQSQQDWLLPSWSRSPFVINDPLQNFSDASYCLIAAGIASMIAELSTTPKTWAWELILSIGVGLFVGVRFSLMLFRAKIKTPSVEQVASR